MLTKSQNSKSIILVTKLISHHRKIDITTSSKVLTSLFKKVLDSDTVPNDWTKGLIVKLPKTGDLQVCDNWRGITLLSTTNKGFCKILLPSG